jgi:cell division protein FtsA
MVKEYPLLAIDIGAHNIKCAIAVRNEETQVIDIISVYTVPTLGIRDGFMEDRDALIDVIQQGIHRVQDSALCVPKEAIFSISSRHFFGLDVYADTGILDGRVTHKDMIKSVDLSHKSVSQKSLTNGYAITHTLPQRFMLDKDVASLSPLGQPALNMQLYAYLMYGHKETINAFWGLGDRLKLPLKDVVCDILVQAEGCLTHHDLQGYITLIDIGNETTSVMIFESGRPIYFHSRFQGGIHLTQEIQNQLKISYFDDAEALKLKHGIVRYEGDRDSPRIPIYHDGPTRYVRQETLTRILERSLTENLSAIRVRIEEDQVSEYLSGGVILTGGSSNIRGIERLASEVLQTNARVCIPTQAGVKDLVQAPQYATVNGLALAGLKERYHAWFSTWRNSLSTIPAVGSKQFLHSKKNWWKRILG